MLEKYICISEASLLFGVTTTTLRRWEKNVVFLPHHRTCGNHRRYSLTEILIKIGHKIPKKQRKTICYARVSSHDQKKDLVR
jgi:predicted site-specific integrase-resolvase